MLTIVLIAGKKSDQFRTSSFAVFGLMSIALNGLGFPL